MSRLIKLFATTFFIMLFMQTQSQVTINYGETLTGNISTGGEIDTYTFSGISGDKLIIRATRNGGSITPRVKLYDPSGDFMTFGEGLDHVYHMDRSDCPNDYELI